MKNFLTLILSLSLIGCVTDQHAEFRGSLTNGLKKSSPGAVYPTGSYFDARNEAFPNVVTGLSLGINAYFLVLVHDREAYEDNNYQILADAVSSIYLTECSVRDDDTYKRYFMKGDESSINRLEDVHRMEGFFNIEKWESSNDFRIRMALRSKDVPQIMIDGVVTSYETRHFRPHETFIVCIGSCIGSVFPRTMGLTKSYSLQEESAVE